MTPHKGLKTIQKILVEIRKDRFSEKCSVSNGQRHIVSTKII
jgi:hypothetical protein